MPRYEVEIYELHVSAYTVEAKSQANAIARALNGSAVFIDNSTEFVTLNVIGLGTQVIPAIRSIKKV